MRTEDMEEQWKIHLDKQPESSVMPCRCGSMPAPVTNISGHERRRCRSCHCSELRMSMDFWEN